MDIIYGYSNCTDKKYNEIFADKSVAVLQPDQKYHGLLIKGLAQNGGAETFKEVVEYICTACRIGLVCQEILC